MLYSEAFAQLGYTLESPRQDWTARRADGVCISLWQKLVQHRDGKPWYDSRLHGGDDSEWREKPGNRKRMRHIAEALADRDGFVDAVIVNGIPGDSYGDAHPWLPANRKGYIWRIVEFDESSGHFRAEVQKQAESS